MAINLLAQSAPERRYMPLGLSEAKGLQQLLEDCPDRDGCARMKTMYRQRLLMSLADGLGGFVDPRVGDRLQSHMRDNLLQAESTKGRPLLQVMVGPPGTGKTLFGKMLASFLQASPALNYLPITINDDLKSFDEMFNIRRIQEIVANGQNVVIQLDEIQNLAKVLDPLYAKIEELESTVSAQSNRNFRINDPDLIGQISSHNQLAQVKINEYQSKVAEYQKQLTSFKAYESYKVEPKEFPELEDEKAKKIISELRPDDNLIYYQGTYTHMKMPVYPEPPISLVRFTQDDLNNYKAWKSFSKVLWELLGDGTFKSDEGANIDVVKKFQSLSVMMEKQTELDQLKIIQEGYQEKLDKEFSTFNMSSHTTDIERANGDKRKAQEALNEIDLKLGSLIDERDELQNKIEQEGEGIEKKSGLDEDNKKLAQYNDEIKKIKEKRQEAEKEFEKADKKVNQALEFYQAQTLKKDEIKNGYDSVDGKIKGLKSQIEGLVGTGNVTIKDEFKSFMAYLRTRRPLIYEHLLREIKSKASLNGPQLPSHSALKVGDEGGDVVLNITNLWEIYKQNTEMMSNVLENIMDENGANPLYSQEKALDTRQIYIVMTGNSDYYTEFYKEAIASGSITHVALQELYHTEPQQALRLYHEQQLLEKTFYRIFKPMMTTVSDGTLNYQAAMDRIDARNFFVPPPDETYWANFIKTKILQESSSSIEEFFDIEIDPAKNAWDQILEMIIKNKYKQNLGSITASSKKRLKNHYRKELELKLRQNQDISAVLSDYVDGSNLSKAINLYDKVRNINEIEKEYPGYHLYKEVRKRFKTHNEVASDYRRVFEAKTLDEVNKLEAEFKQSGRYCFEDYVKYRHLRHFLLDQIEIDEKLLKEIASNINPIQMSRQGFTAIRTAIDKSISSVLEQVLVSDEKGPSLEKILEEGRKVTIRLLDYEGLKDFKGNRLYQGVSRPEDPNKKFVAFTWKNERSDTEILAVRDFPKIEVDTSQYKNSLYGQVNTVIRGQLEIQSALVFGRVYYKNGLPRNNFFLEIEDLDAAIVGNIEAEKSAMNTFVENMERIRIKALMLEQIIRSKEKAVQDFSLGSKYAEKLISDLSSVLSNYFTSIQKIAQKLDLQLEDFIGGDGGDVKKLFAMISQDEDLDFNEESLRKIATRFYKDVLRPEATEILESNKRLLDVIGQVLESATKETRIGEDEILELEVLKFKQQLLSQVKVQGVAAEISSRKFLEIIMPQEIKSMNDDLLNKIVENSKLPEIRAAIIIYAAKSEGEIPDLRQLSEWTTNKDALKINFDENINTAVKKYLEFIDRKISVLSGLDIIDQARRSELTNKTYNEILSIVTADLVDLFGKFNNAMEDQTNEWVKRSPDDLTDFNRELYLKMMDALKSQKSLNELAREVVNLKVKEMSSELSSSYDLKLLLSKLSSAPMGGIKMSQEDLAESFYEDLVAGRLKGYNKKGGDRAILDILSPQTKGLSANGIVRSCQLFIGKILHK